MERTQDNLTQNKNSFLMYLDHITVIDALSNEDAGMLIKALYYYASGNGNPSNLSPVANVVFLMMQSQMKLDLKKWRDICNKNKQNISKRWNKKTTTVYDRIPSDTKNTDNEYEYEKENENEDINIIKNEFEELWKKYPADSRRNKDKCFNVYKKLNKQEKIDIVTAFTNYQTSKKYKDGFIQNSITWFNDWKTWLEYKQETKQETMYDREQKIREERSRYLDEHSKGASND